MILKTSLWLPAALVVVAAPHGAQVQHWNGPSEPLANPPNVLLIVLDDVGIDKLGFYEQTPEIGTQCPTEPCTNATDFARYPLTPNLDALVGDGILFRNAYANPLCSPTRACLLTGRYPFRTGIGTVTTYKGQPQGYESVTLSDSEILLPELLRYGYPTSLSWEYRCGAFGKWHLTNEADSGDASHAIDNGFHRFQGTLKNIDAMTGPEEDYYSWTRYVGPGNTKGQGSGWNGSVTRADAVTWINAQPETDPYFAYVGFNPPHKPLQLPPLDLVSAPTLLEIDRAQYNAGDIALDNDSPVKKRLFYRAMIEAVDHEIGELLAALDPGKLANTLIIVMGDNGTPSDVMDTVNTLHHTPNHGKSSLYEWGVRVPLVVSGPFIANPGVTDALVHAVDIWPTIAAITGADPRLAFEASGLSEDPVIDGVSFLPAIVDPTHPGRDFVFCEYFTPNRIPGTTPMPGGGFYPVDACFKAHRRCITNGDYKYISLQESRTTPTCTDSFGYDPPELYSLLLDREETTPLSNPAGCEEVIFQWMRGRLLATSGYY